MIGEASGFDVDRVVRAQLEPGERLVWSGRPDSRAFARLAGPIRTFGNIFFGFAVFWTVMATVGSQLAYWLAKGVPPLVMGMPLFGLLFMFVGWQIKMIPVKRARATAYGLTDRRTVVVQSLYPMKQTVVRSYGPEQLRAIEVELLDDGGGSVVFERVEDEAFRSRPSSRSPRGFVGVQDVKRVERLVRELAAKNA
ncbi:MAG: hypothetical protein QM783_19195 [Phycisphaerales bacterium]